MAPGATRCCCCRVPRLTSPAEIDGLEPFEPDLREADAVRWRALDPIGFATFWLEAATSFEPAGQFLPLARALHNLAEKCLRRGEPLPGQRLATRACELKRSLAPAASYANSLNTWGVAERLLGSPEAATDDLEEALALAARAGNRMIHSYALNNLAEVATDRRLGARPGALCPGPRREGGATRHLLTGLHAAQLVAVRAPPRRPRSRPGPRLALQPADRTLPDPDEQALFDLALGAAVLAAGRDADAAAALEGAARQAAASDAKLTLAGAWLQQRVLRRDVTLAAKALDLGQGHQMAALVPEARLACRTHPGLAVPPALDRLLPSPHHQQPARWGAAPAPGHVPPPLGPSEWLWPEQGEGALASLHAAVNTVRAILDEAGGNRGWLRRQDLSHSLGPLASTDVDRFESLVAAANSALRAGRREPAAARLGWALDLWRGAEVLPEDRYAAWAGWRGTASGSSRRSPGFASPSSR